MPITPQLTTSSPFHQPTYPDADFFRLTSSFLAMQSTTSDSSDHARQIRTVRRPTPGIAIGSALNSVLISPSSDGWIMCRFRRLIFRFVKSAGQPQPKQVFTFRPWIQRYKTRRGINQSRVIHQLGAAAAASSSTTPRHESARIMLHRQTKPISFSCIIIHSPDGAIVQLLEAAG